MAPENRIFGSQFTTCCLQRRVREGSGFCESGRTEQKWGSGRPHPVCELADIMYPANAKLDGVATANRTKPRHFSVSARIRGSEYRI